MNTIITTNFFPIYPTCLYQKNLSFYKFLLFLSLPTTHKAFNLSHFSCLNYFQCICTSTINCIHVVGHFKVDVDLLENVKCQKNTMLPAQTQKNVYQRVRQRKCEYIYKKSSHKKCHLFPFNLPCSLFSPLQKAKAIRCYFFICRGTKKKVALFYDYQVFMLLFSCEDWTKLTDVKNPKRIDGFQFCERKKNC